MASRNLARLVPMLEKVSALKISDNPELIARLEESIKYASILEQVNIDGVEPMYHIEEQGRLHLQEDKVEPQDKSAVMKNAGKKVEDYFVSPLSISHREAKGKDDGEENVGTNI